MRLYEVTFSHKSFGMNWSREIVAVRGLAKEAIRVALSRRNGDRKYCFAQEVKLIAEET